MVGLDLSPPTATLGLQTSQRFVVTGVYADGSTEDLTAVAQLSASAPVVAVAQGGNVRAVSAGSATLTATVGGSEARADLVVTGAPLRALQVTQETSTLARDTGEQLAALGLFADGTTQDLTDQVTWSSSSPALTIDDRGFAQAAGAAPGVEVTASFLGLTGSTRLDVTPASLVYLDVDPSFSEVTKGTVIDYRATGTFSDNTTQDLTRAVDWTSSVPAVATVNEAGVTRTVGTGETTITARAGTFRGNAGVFVKPATLDVIRVSRPVPSIPKGSSILFGAEGVYSDGTVVNITNQVAWVSGNPAVVLSNAPGSRGRAYAAGVASNVDVSALLTGINGTSSLSVTPAELTTLAIGGNRPFPLGTSLQLTATGTYTDGSTLDLTSTVAWSSGNLGVATIAPGGLARSVGEGATLVTAATQGVRASAPLQVTPVALTALDLTPVEASVKQGATLVFGATARYSDGTSQNVTAQAEWSSSDPAIAEVSNAAGFKGRTFGANPGRVTLTTLFGGQRGTANLTVTPAAALVYVANDRATISAYTRGENGALTRVPGSPFAAPGVDKLSFTPDGRFLYAAGQSLSGFAINQYNGGLAPLPGSPYSPERWTDLSAVRAGLVYTCSLNSRVQGWKADSASGALTLNGPPAATGNFPFSLAVDAAGRFLYTANTFDRSISGFALDATGALSPLPGSPFSTGERIGPIQVIVDPRGRLVYAGHETGEVTGYNVSPSGALTPLPESFISGGTSPVLAFEPAGRFAYSANRTQFRFQPPGVVCSLTAQPNGELEVTGFNVGNTPVAVTVDPSGRFVYTANEDNNTVSAWTIGAGGALTPVPGSPFPTGPIPSAVVAVP